MKLDSILANCCKNLFEVQTSRSSKVSLARFFKDSPKGSQKRGHKVEPQKQGEKTPKGWGRNKAKNSQESISLNN